MNGTISVNTILASTSLLVSIITIGTVIYSSATRIAKIEVKVETLWAFLMRRGAAEAVSNDLATMESPLYFKESALVLLDPIKDGLHQLAAENPHDNALELLFKIEAKFGVFLMMEFCIPMKTYYGACNLAALQVAKQKPVDPLEALA